MGEGGLREDRQVILSAKAGRRRRWDRGVKRAKRNHGRIKVGFSLPMGPMGPRDQECQAGQGRESNVGSLC